MTILVRPIGYDISIRKKGDLFLFKYTEFFDKESQEHIAAMEQSIKELEIVRTNAPRGCALVELQINQESYSVSMEKEMSFEDIADQITAEFITFGRMGKVSIKNIFDYVACHELGIG